MTSFTYPLLSNMKIIYITGLSRSGTTYLSNSMVRELNVISIGEVAKNIEIYQNKKEKERYKNENRKCTCGEYPEDCSFWGDLLDGVDDITDHEAFELTIKKVQKTYPGGIILDTSKSVKRLERFYKNEILEKHNIQLISINIIRHCLGQIESYQKYHKLRNRRGFNALILADAIYWLVRNFRNIHFLNNKKIPCKTIFYEDLIFHQKETIGSIKDFIAREFGDYNFENSVIHEMSGNEGFKNGGLNSVRYQTKWMFNFKFTALFSILLPFLIMNNIWYKKYKVIKD